MAIGNPVLSFYANLGFGVVAKTELHHGMEWVPRAE